MDEYEEEVEEQPTKEVEVEVEVEEQPTKEVEKKKEAKLLKQADEKAAKEQKLADEKAAKEQKMAEEKALRSEKEQKIAEEKAKKEQKMAEEKAKKEQKMAEEKAAKEAKLLKQADEKAAKEQKIADEKAAVALKKQQLEEEKALKKQQQEAEKALKKQQQEAEKAPKEKEPKEKKQKEGTRSIVATKANFKVGDKVKHNEKGVETIATVTEVKMGKSFVEYELRVDDETVFVAPEGNIMLFKESESAAPAPKKVTVKRITIEGKQYLKTADNLLYDPETKEEMGIYDPATNTIKSLPDDSEDELSEDEYDNEA